VKIFSIVTLIMINVFVIIAQTNKNYFNRNMIIGTSLTYMLDQNSDMLNSTYKYHELTWNANISVSINKRIFLGMQYLSINTKETNKANEHYDIYGLFLQYNFLKNRKNRLFIENSISKGNYCMCDNEEYEKIENLYYLGIGIGYDLSLNKFLNGLYLDLSFLKYITHIQSYKIQSYYTQYIIGLNYRFGKE